MQFVIENDRVTVFFTRDSDPGREDEVRLARAIEEGRIGHSQGSDQ